MEKTQQSGKGPIIAGVILGAIIVPILALGLGVNYWHPHATEMFEALSIVCGIPIGAIIGGLLGLLVRKLDERSKSTS